MSLFPKIKKCPCCNAINIIRVNGTTYENNFQSIADCTFKKFFNCKKCKEELGIYVDHSSQKERVIWLAYYKCTDDYFNDLSKLQAEKNKSPKLSKRYFAVLKEIQTIQNIISLNQIKLKIKAKIRNRGYTN